MMNKLREQNKLMLYKYSKENNAKEIAKHTIIGELLKSDDCFQKLSLDEAYTILKSLNVDDWKEMYVKLVNKK